MLFLHIFDPIFPQLLQSSILPVQQQEDNNILLKTERMKRSLLLKQNKSVHNIKASVLHPPLLKEHKPLLPPLNPNPNLDMQKTLAFLLLKIDNFINQYPGAIADLFSKCIDSVNLHLARASPHQGSLAKSIAISNHQRTEPSGLEEEWGVRSQVMSVKRTDLQKVESRKLFEKMRAAKHEDVPLKNEKEEKSITNSRLAEMEQACAALKIKLEECKEQLQEKETNLSLCRNRMASAEKNFSNLMSQKNEVQIRLEQAQLSGKKQENLIFELEDKWKRSEQQLLGREQQLKALWQVYLSSKACIL